MQVVKNIQGDALLHVFCEFQENVMLNVWSESVIFFSSMVLVHAHWWIRNRLSEKEINKVVALGIAVQSTVVRVVITLHECLSPFTPLLFGITLGKNGGRKKMDLG